MKCYYDFHIHTCLSPCADNDNTPNNIVGLACLIGLNAIAITDHNSMKNVKAVMELGEENGIVVLPGMELTTAEEIHMLCLFDNICDAEKFSNVVDARMLKIKNKESIYGEQIVMDSNDNEVERIEHLLFLSSNISLMEAKKLVEDFNGVAIPAHIDRDSYSVLAVLGSVEKEWGFTALEVSKNANDKFYEKNSYLKDYIVLKDSDAHALENLNEAENYIEIDVINAKSIIDFLKKESS